MLTEQLQKFINDMTYSMYADFYKAMIKRKDSDEKLQRFLNPKGYLDDTEIALMKQGEKIQAIKHIRARTGFGLVDSKNMCDWYHQDHFVNGKWI